MQSETINELAAALCEAQIEFPKVVKGKTARIKHEKGTFEYRYADLGEVIETVRPVLSKHGLSVSQAVDSADGKMTLVTRLMHKSGQYISGSMPINFNGGDPKQLGSTMTYYRRYSYTAILGVAAEEDDDGNAADQSNPARKTTASPARQPAKQSPQGTRAANADAMQGPPRDFDPADEPETVPYTASNGRIYEIGVDNAVQRLWKACEAPEVSDEAFDDLLRRNEKWMERHAKTALASMRQTKSAVAA